MVQSVQLPMYEDINVNDIGNNITLYSIIYIDEERNKYESTKAFINELVDLINQHETMNLSVAKKSIRNWIYEK